MHVAARRSRPFVLTIEHIGSTAVPGFAAKPNIDLQASVRRLAEARSRCVEPLQTLGYTYLPQYEAWLPGELFFRKALAGPWTLHLKILKPRRSPMAGPASGS